MKLLRILLVAALLVPVLTGAAFAFEKTVLIEYFTNTGCGPCAGEHDPIENMLANYTRDEIAFICYHVSWPSSSDGYYQGNIGENSGRRNYYGFNSVPWFEGDGVYENNYLNNILPQSAARIGDYTPFDIDLGDWPAQGTTVPITATVTCAEATTGDMRVNIVLVDKMQVVPPGSNGIDDYKYNMLDMAFSYSGQTFTSTGGNQQLDFSYEFDIPANNTFGNLAVVAYVQNYSTGEIMQSAFISSPEVVISGTVTHAITGLPMWLAVVQLNGGDDGEDLTGQDGHYSFNGLGSGDYAFSVFMNNYETLEIPAEFFDYGNHTRDFELMNQHDGLMMVSGIGSQDVVSGAYEVGDLVYLAQGTGGFTIVDISDFENPEMIWSMSVGDDLMDVVVDGDYAYAAGVNGVYVIDLSGANPELVATVTTSSSCFNIDKSGNYVYVAGASAGLVVIDATTPASASLVTEFDTPGYARDLYVMGNYVYMADGSQGLAIIDVSTPGSPSLVSNLNSPGYAGGVELIGDTAYIADDSNGVMMIDVSDVNNPTDMGSFATTGRAKQLDSVDNFLIVAEYTDGVYAYSLTGTPAQVGYTLTPGANTNNVTAFGDHLYVADDDWMLFTDASGLATTPGVVFEVTGINTQIPAGGGTLTYNVDFQYNLPNPVNSVEYWTKVTTPGGQTLGPIMLQSFNATPGMQVNTTIAHQVPGTLGAGTYIYRAYLGNYPNPQLMDTFEFTKDGNALADVIDLGEWTTTGGFDNLSQLASEFETVLPIEYAIENAYPNPFNPTTTINVALPEAAELNVTVYNVIGQQVAQLANGRMDAGRHTLTFDASNLSSGLYFVRATVPGHLNDVQKVMLVR
ncbi:T9SS type A sorting domain-containing protein [bacterium]|nr:T9SS type A sorting domain-containing protein [bacterium]